MVMQGNVRLEDHRNRDVRFELLRILAMFLIVLCHLVAHSGWHLEELPGWKGTVFMAVDNYAGQTGVALFLLISGYFLVKKQFSWWRIARTMIQTWCYSAVLALLMYVVSEFTPYFQWIAGSFSNGAIAHSLVLLLLPTLNGEYWFITAYVLTLLISPFLNMVLRSASRKQLLALIGFLAFLSVMPYISFHPEGPHDAFYWTPLTYALTLYIVGGWIRLYGFGAVRIRVWHLVAYAIVSFVVLVCLLQLWRSQSYVSLFFVWNPKRIYGSFPILPVLLSAGMVGFVAGSGANSISSADGAKGRMIASAASAMFGVYLIHQHALMSSAVWYFADKATVHTSMSIISLAGLFVATLLIMFMALTAASLLFDRLITYPVQALVRRLIERMSHAGKSL
ncbi:acyltransferase [Bifidobacterium sp. SO4]|uniref:acyltransferase family protein n=1 Tax=Bifidobacterium sp. SO4 TaxID=2809030 RepID=UPI001BDCB1C4|nr:acyltransferase [Bifidobacterium sp. SO4]MBT1171738.1 acyltransferase [Bifidobacterium sp. SO4]